MIDTDWHKNKRGEDSRQFFGKFLVNYRVTITCMQDCYFALPLTFLAAHTNIKQTKQNKAPKRPSKQSTCATEVLQTDFERRLLLSSLLSMFKCSRFVFEGEWSPYDKYCTVM